MLEYVIIFVIVGIAACFVVTRLCLRKNTGCGCGNGAACACSKNTAIQEHR